MRDFQLPEGRRRAGQPQPWTCISVSFLGSSDFYVGSQKHNFCSLTAVTNSCVMRLHFFLHRPSQGERMHAGFYCATIHFEQTQPFPRLKLQGEAACAQRKRVRSASAG